MSDKGWKRHPESGLLKKILNYKATEQSRARKRVGGAGVSARHSNVRQT
ncbi:conserved hypothetical protein [Neisseria gonorrhoeae]|uniref:Phage associated protein n=1 Tax=Neisseria gonorrhoeae TaxID=485 RepID=A0AB74EQ01_NEIGO|nr:conserved hypothetical protein [Neisseria gonorrhoeae]SCW10856.1 conserved hypothetical protein [Neisseria gonorrhoeae]SCW11256.1 conserved hypothetical protein [Neisseria gonorrhoeae]SCW12731.1 conserved hypothetical protein [Neisseria gonorrhoeae]SCW12767.1 conserved hypothetical protein [Neisseria gonorrhoeae]